MVGSGGTQSSYLGFNGEDIYYNGSGGLAIGDVEVPDGFKFAVNGDIKVKGIRVSVNDWADNVFNKDYDLMSISELQKEIKRLGHLPEVPSEEKVKLEGIDIETIQVLLLRKIEELTLYIIEQQQQIDALQQEVSKSK